MLQTAQDIIEQVEKLRYNIKQRKQQVKFIGIAGGRCSGKSTITNVIREYFREDKNVSLINMKYFLRDMKPNIKRVYNGQVNMEDPMMIDEIQLLRCLRDLQNNKPVTVYKYDMEKCKHTDEKIIIEPREIVIIHGAYAFYWPHVRDIIRIRIYVDCCGEIRLSRLLMARQEKNPSNVIAKFYKFIRPSHQLFVQQQKKYANVVITWEQDEKMKLEIIEILINQLQNIAQGAQCCTSIQQ